LTPLISDLSTTVCRLTSNAPSAIAVLELHGPSALKLVEHSWTANQGSSHLVLNRVRYGFTSSGESIVVCRTGEQRVELHCHGGKRAADRIIRTMVDGGAILIQSPEISGGPGLDLIQHEALEDLVHAKTIRTTSILLDQMRGALSIEMAHIRTLAKSGCIDSARDRMRKLRDRFEIGKHLIAPWQVILTGPPNAGKSSLLNRLLGYTRAMVHAQAGTTRDLIKEQTSLDGWPVELVDSAGIRSLSKTNESENQDDIEQMGIDRSLTEVTSADCMLLLVAVDQGWTVDHDRILEQSTCRAILVLTKTDLWNGESDPRFMEQIQRFRNAWGDRIEATLPISSLNLQGLNLLTEAIVSSLVRTTLQPGEPIPFRARHVESDFQELG
jgi:tRNA modification GTPase